MDEGPARMRSSGGLGPKSASPIRRSLLLAAVLVSPVLAACGEEGLPAPPFPAFEQIRVEWSYCSLYPGENDGIADCATTRMPLRWEDPSGPTVPVRAKRLLAPSRATAQIWLLAGGPGGSGTIGLPDRMDYIQKLNPDVEVYTLDARGTGESDFLECPDEQSPESVLGGWIGPEEVEPCLERVRADHGDVLDFYGVTESSFDLAAYIHATREPGKRVLIWGGSGGASWAQRYLTLFPNQVDGVILEGIPPANFSLVFQDEYDERIGREILALCARDAACSARLPDPEAALRNLYGRLAAGHCPQAEQRLPVRGVLNFLTTYYPFSGMVPGMIARLHRCAPADLAVLDGLVDRALGLDKPERYLSQVVHDHVIYSEQWEHERFAGNDELLAYLDGIYAGETLFAWGQGYAMNDAFLRWPRTRDPLDDAWPVTGIPVLMLQGRLDPATPADHAALLSMRLAGPRQRYVVFPYGSHNVIAGTPVESGPPPLHCADRIFSAFLADPEADLDLSCVAETRPPDFEGSRTAPRLIGQPNYWDNVDDAVPAETVRSGSMRPDPLLGQRAGLRFRAARETVRAGSTR